MNQSVRAVIVKQIPGKCDGANVRKFLQDLALEFTQTVRPAVVLDCSLADTINRQTLHLILCALEEAMKRNGDVRLAGLPQDARSVLEFCSVARLFQSFPTTAEAIRSFRRSALDRTNYPATEPATNQTEANAA